MFTVFLNVFVWMLKAAGGRARTICGVVGKCRQTERKEEVVFAVI